MRRTLAVEGSLTLEGDGSTIEITATDGRVRAEIGALPVRRTFRLVRTSAQLARRLSRELDENGMTVSVTRNGKAVLEIGRGVRTTRAQVAPPARSETGKSMARITSRPIGRLSWRASRSPRANRNH